MCIIPPSHLSRYAAETPRISSLVVGSATPANSHATNVFSCIRPYLTDTLPSLYSRYSNRLRRSDLRNELYLPPPKTLQRLKPKHLKRMTTRTRSIRRRRRRKRIQSLKTRRRKRKKTRKACCRRSCPCWPCKLGAGDFTPPYSSSFGSQSTLALINFSLKKGKRTRNKEGTTDGLYDVVFLFCVFLSFLDLL